MTMSPGDLANLNDAAVATYDRNLGLYLKDPERLGVLYGSKFLGSGMVERAKVVCNTAQALTGLPAVLVLITDTDVTTVATSDDYPSTGVHFAHGALAASFCKYTVNERQPFAVESATQHRLVCYSEAVTGPLGVRAYLGVPIIVEGQAIGSLCIWGTVEREFTTLDVEVLVNLAAVLVALATK